MATISKFYLLDAASPNTGTLPSGALLTDPSGTTAATGDASGARTARDATDTVGTSNPDIESLVTATADTNAQAWGHRRFISRPLAARTFAAADGNWTFSYARVESNTAHNQLVHVTGYSWRPSTGARVGAVNTGLHFFGTEPGTTSVEAESVVANWVTNVTITDGDILVFDITTQFTQSMAVAYTDGFEYNGTTEASITTCASFISPPVALTVLPAPTVHPFNPIPFMSR